LFSHFDFKINKGLTVFGYKNIIISESVCDINIENIEFMSKLVYLYSNYSLIENDYNHLVSSVCVEQMRVLA
jgi:hypothetical protein